jgi:SAM-dependent methyltransferase
MSSNSKSLTGPNLRSPDAYSEIAELYDLEHASYADDLDFYLNFVESVGDPVLELGCGTGRLLAPIAEAGFRITGVDLSAAMLSRAEQAVSDAALQDLVQLHLGDMSLAQEAPGGPFGVAIVALNGLLHIADFEQQRRLLTNAHAALDPRGLLLIDVLHPTPDTLRGFDHSLIHEGTWTTDDGVRVDKFSSRRVYPSTQTIATELWYDLTGPDGSVRRVATSMAMRYVQRAELELMLELAGFVEWQIYGSYDLDPFGDHSERLIVAAEVTRS